MTNISRRKKGFRKRNLLIIIRKTNRTLPQMRNAHDVKEIFVERNLWTPILTESLEKCFILFVCLMGGLVGSGVVDSFRGQGVTGRSLFSP